MSGYAELLITGKPISEIMNRLDSIVRWQGGKDYEVKVINNDGTYFFDVPSNIRNEVLTDLTGYIQKNLVNNGKSFKYGGDLTHIAIVDPWDNDQTPTKSEVRQKRSNGPMYFGRTHRGTNMTPPKKKRKKR